MEDREYFGSKYLNIKASYKENFHFDINRLFFDSLEDNWEIVEED